MELLGIIVIIIIIIVFVIIYAWHMCWKMKGSTRFLFVSK
jgi:hypothetical protein